MIFKTESGSYYEIDADNLKIRRMYGVKSPTQRQGNDGEWKHYLSITNVVVGKPVLIIWKVNETLIVNTTMTSNVIEIHDKTVN